MNKELLKVIAGLECCIDVGNKTCNMCPYKDDCVTGCKCINDLMRDALEILREVERDGLY